jgi:plastocyanin
MKLQRNMLALVALLAVPAVGTPATSGVTVRAQIEVGDSTSLGSARSPAAEIVVWLNPHVGQDDPGRHPVQPGQFRMEQKNKNFHPHILVVPLGSSVEFPNLDPFFHNVFSQFNGKRFDLGLYEAGSTRTVRFDHEGVSYIFCNIHSKMAAVIVTLATPYFAVARESGTVEIREVPPGDYDLHVWAEGEDAERLSGVARRVHVGPGDTDLGAIRVTTPGPAPTHKNKFGEDYPPERASPYP